MSSIFPKYAVVVFVIGLYFVAGTVLVSYYVTAAIISCAQVLYTENRQHGSTTCLEKIGSFMERYLKEKEEPK
jgi:cytochrome c biogenesis protein CcdA